MAILKPRTKVVFFRVSEEEFHQMEEACSAVGARTISDFARTAAREFMKAKPEERVDQLARSFEMINDCLERLYKRVEDIYPAKRDSPVNRDGPIMRSTESEKMG